MSESSGAWTRFLEEVEATQAAQYDVIRWLADRELVLSIGPDGLWRPVPTSAVQAREDAIVRNLLAAAQPNVVVALGKAHDLREPIRRMLVGRCEYVRVVCRPGLHEP